MYSSLFKHFDELCIQKDKPLLVHSSLFPFYQADNPQFLLYNSLTNYIAKCTPLAFPTYILNGDLSYNPITSPSSLGLFSNYILQLPHSIRTYSAIHNHVFFNSGIDPLLLDYHASFGENTDFAYFYEHDFDLLLFGIDFQYACTYIHHLEALFQVPYRNEILIPRTIVIPPGDNSTSIMYKYFARNSLARPSDFNKVITHLSSNLSISELNGFTSYRISIRTLHTSILTLLTADPFFLLTHA